MKKFVFLLAFLLLATYGYSAEVSKQDWEEYQQYKKEKAEKIVNVSDEEYEQYQQYLKEKEQKEETINQETNTEEKDINKEETAESNPQKETKSKTSENEIILGFGKDLSTSTEVKVKNIYSGARIKNTTTNSDGWVLKIDYFHYLAKNTAIGAGIAYDFEFDDFSEGLLPVDFLFKQRFPLHVNRENVYLFLIGGIGYASAIGTTKEYFKEDPNYYVELSGGIHFRLSFGIDFTPFTIELSYSYNNLDISTNLPDISYEGSMSAFILSLGYKFIL